MNPFNFNHRRHSTRKVRGCGVLGEDPPFLRERQAERLFPPASIIAGPQLLLGAVDSERPQRPACTIFSVAKIEVITTLTAAAGARIDDEPVVDRIRIGAVRPGLIERERPAGSTIQRTKPDLIVMVGPTRPADEKEACGVERYGEVLLEFRLDCEGPTGAVGYIDGKEITILACSLGVDDVFTIRSEHRHRSLGPRATKRDGLDLPIRQIHDPDLAILLEEDSLAVGCEPRVLVSRAELLGEVQGFRPAVQLPKVDIPRIAAMSPSRDSHEHDLFAVRGEIAVDRVVDLPALAQASEPLRREVVEIEAAVPRVVIRIAVEDDPATKLRSGVGRIRRFGASAAPRTGGCGLAADYWYGTHTPKDCARHRRGSRAIAEIVRLTRLASYHLCARGCDGCREDSSLEHDASEFARGFHGSVHRLPAHYRLSHEASQRP